MSSDVAERMVYPAMPPCMAYFCCVLNFIIPGLGTILAGLSTFCCAKNDDMEIGEMFTSCCCGLFFGVLQLIFTLFLLLGWFWSAIWGCGYIDMSKKYYRRNHENLTVHPISEQHIQHLPAINRLHLRRNRCDEIHVSVIPYSRDFIPPPAYQEITRGEQGVQDLPPSYDSLYPGRAPN